MILLLQWIGSDEKAVVQWRVIAHLYIGFYFFAYEKEFIKGDIKIIASVDKGQYGR